MRMACSWCNKTIHQSIDQSTTNQSLEKSLSHSICLLCIDKMKLFDEIDGSSINSSLTYGQAVIDKDNKITSYETFDVNPKSKILENSIGKDYFEEFNPTLAVKSLKYKLSGLRRRKKDGQLELQFLIKDEENIHFSSIEMTHFKTSGDTLINMKLIKKEEF